jgi:hypothetical protein
MESSSSKKSVAKTLRVIKCKKSDFSSPSASPPDITNMLLNTLNKDTNMKEEEDESSGAETIIHDLSSKPLQNRCEIVKESYDPIPYNSKAITKLPHTEILEACPNITVRELAEC